MRFNTDYTKRGVTEQEFYSNVTKSLIQNYYSVFYEDFEIGGYENTLNHYLDMGMQG